MGLFSRLFRDEFEEWVKNASKKELEDAYEVERQGVFKRTGKKTPKMERLNTEKSSEWKMQN